MEGLARRERVVSADVYPVHIDNVVDALKILVWLASLFGLDFLF